MPALRLAVPVLVVLALGCAGSPPPARAPAPAATPGLSSGGRAFDAERAYDDVRRLVAIGPRTSGSDGAARAREYLRGELEKLGLDVDEITIELPAQLASDAEGEEGSLPRFVHLGARIPGDGVGRGEVMLGASYDTAPAEDFENVAANGAASGPALVLELARLVSANPLPYDTRVVFLDGDLGGSDSRQRMGSRLWARDLRDAGRLDDIRLAMFFRQVCDPDLRFERDLFSNRTYREVVWRAARRSGHSDAFPPDADFGTPSASHHSLIEGGMRRVVALVDDAYGGTESPGALAGTADDDLAHCSAESLGVTGAVAMQALEDLTRMLSKVDRLSPDEQPEAPSEPRAEEAGPPPVGESDGQGADATAEPEAAEPGDPGSAGGGE
jgi:hypothetical protein